MKKYLEKLPDSGGGIEQTLTTPIMMNVVD